MSTSQNAVFRDHVYMHLIVLVWGYTAILGKWSTLPADVLVFLRMASAFFVLAVFARGSLFSIDRKSLLCYLGIGVLIALHWVTFFSAISLSNVSLALTCMASTSFFAALLEPFIFRRKVQIAELGFSLMAALGVSFLFGIASGYRMGIAMALLSSLLAALFTILNGVMFRRVKQSKNDSENTNFAVVMTTYEMLGGLLFLGALHLFRGAQTLVSGEGFFASFAHWNLNPQNLLIATILGVVCTAVPFVGSIGVMRSLSPFTICLTVNLEPIYAILLALLHFGESEKMSEAFYAAALLILAAVIANSIVKSRSGNKQTLA